MTSIHGTDQRSRLIAQASAIVPLLQANAPSCESQRRLTQDNLEAMDKAGLFALRAPRRFGGLQADLRTYVDVVAELGRGCASTAWIAFISDATGEEQIHVVAQDGSGPVEQLSPMMSTRSASSVASAPRMSVPSSMQIGRAHV